jgi:hypothetical protein
MYGLRMPVRQMQRIISSDTALSSRFAQRDVRPPSITGLNHYAEADDIVAVDLFVSRCHP